MLNDLRLAVRALRRTPGFALVAMLTMALGIAAATTIFSVVYGVLFRPLPFPDPDRIVLIEGWNDQFSGRQTRANYSLADLSYWRDRRQTFDAMSLTTFESMSLSTSGGSEAVLANVVSPGFFEVVRGQLAAGRLFTTADDDAPVAVITARLWRRVLNEATDAIGSRLLLNSRAYVVVGVIDESFRAYDTVTDVWLTAGFALAVNPALDSARSGSFSPIGRLKKGVSIAQAQSDVDAISRALAHDRPEQYARVRANVVGLQGRLIGDVRPALLILLAAVGLVLIVACANVANLLLTRNVSRARELAIRQSLGASRGQLARTSLAESAAIAVAGAIAGTLLAAWFTSMLIWLEPKGLPKLDAIRIDAPVLLFVVLVTAFTALVVGLVPVFHTPDAGDVLRVSATTTGAPRARRFRGALVIAELSVSLVLLVGAGLLGRSFARLISTDIGVATDHLSQSLVVLSLGRTLSPDNRIALVDRIVEHVSALPGVQAAGVTASLPPNRPRSRVSFTAIDQTTGRPTRYLLDAVATTPGFFQAMRLPLLKGRWFTAADDASARPVMIVSALTARRFFRDRDPIGRTLPLGLPQRPDGSRPDVLVVGVVGDVKYNGMDAPADGAIYRPFAQYTTPSVFVVVRTNAEPSALTSTLRRELTAIDSGLAIYAIGTVDDLVADAVAQPRFRMTALASLAGLALALAAVGLYGVVAYSVSQRTTEIGIRVALGARTSDVLALIVGQGLRLGVVGVAMGLVASFALTRTLAALLYGIAPTDPWSFVGAAGTMLLVTLVASYLPARRAARIDPVVALRGD